MEEIGQKLVLEGAADFVGKFRDAQNASKNFTDAAEGGGGKVSHFGDIVTGALRKVGEVAINALGKAAGAIKDFVGDSIQMAGDFEGGMNRFSVAVGGAMEESGMKTQDFEKLFLDLGAKLPVSTADVQKAAIELAKGGFDPLVISGGALEKVINLAAASNLSLEEAANRSVKTMASFVDTTKPAAEQTKQLNEMLEITMKVANAGSSDFAPLNDAMMIAGGAAKAAGVENKDFAVTMGYLTDHFPSAAEAGTSYKNFLSSLTFSTKNQYAMAQKLGLVTEDGKNKMYDAQGAYIGNAQAAELLQQAMGDLSAEQLNEATKVLFGNDAKGAAIALMQAGGEGIDAYAAKVDKAAGIQEAAAAQQKGFNTAMDNFKGSVEAVQIVIGQVFLPILTTLFNDYLAPAVNKVQAFAMAFKNSEDRVQFLKDAMEKVLPGFGEFMSKVGEIVGSIINLAQNFDASKVNVSGYAAEFTAAKDTAISVFNSLKQIVGDALKILSDFWDKNGTEIKAFVKDAWDKIQEIIKLGAGLVKEVITGTFSKIATFIHEHGDEIKAALDLAWKAIKLVVDTTLGLIKGAINLTMGLIKGDWKQVWDSIQQISDTIWKAMKDAIDLTINAIKLVVVTVLKAMGADMDDIMTKAKSAMQKVWDAVKLLISLAMTAINKDTIEKFTNLKDKAVEMLNGLLAKAKEIMDNVRLAIVNAVINAYNGVLDKLGDFISLGGKIINKIIEGINSIGGKIADAVKGYVAGALSAAWETIQGWLSKLSGAVTGASNVAGKFFGSNVQGQNSPSQLGGGTSNTSVAYANNYNLNVNSSQSTGTIVSDFSVMASLYGN